MVDLSASSLILLEDEEGYDFDDGDFESEEEDY